MLPLQQAFEVRSAIEEYLKATFSFKNKDVHRAFYEFINHPEEGIFKGPYISLKLPFLTAPEGQSVPLTIAPGFPPYRHQYESFRRLTTEGGNNPKPTLITTGTSSGKTESFLLPLLDYCHKHQERQGIKAIILYPMNALATDQAKRLAELIWKDERLKGRITAGLFIGEGAPSKGRTYHKDMGADHIIEDRRSIVQSPPDILLTNFKMLDYGLMKGEFDTLWHFNYKDAELLRFLVLDELHTYDGAQGTDVANLVRRLKLKLKIPAGQLCPVGTSATIGNSPDAMESLVKYASKVFGETITIDAVLTENRLALDSFLPEPHGGFINSWPHPNAILRSRIGAHESHEAYLRKQKNLWQLDPNCVDTELGQELKKLKITYDLLGITAEGIIHLDDLKTKLAAINPAFAALQDWDTAHQYSPRDQVLQSLLSLLAAARTQSGTNKVPFLYMQVQLWVRELTGVLRKTTPDPVFTWKSTAETEDRSKALPAYHCRECGSCGWLGVRHDNEQDKLQPDIAAVYTHYFENHKNLFFVNTKQHEAIEEFRPTDTLGRHCYLESDTLYLADRAGDGRFEVVGYRVLRADNNNKARHICPECNTEDSIAIIGTRVATLSSITVSQVLSSDLDPRPDQQRKILAFTNSVQDAAHQAGFTEARNYRFTFRASLQQVLNQVDAPVPLPELERRFVQFWKDHADPTGHKDQDAYVYRFFPSDYKGKVNLNTDFRDPVTRKFQQSMLQELDNRVGWEILSEYGYNAQVGRTLEKTGASAVHFDEERIGQVFPSLSDWLAANNLGMITAQDCTAYVHGLLQRMRIRGAVHHTYLGKYRTNGLRLWDLNWQRDGRHFLNRMFGPKTRKPKVLVTTARPPEGADTTYSLSTNWHIAYFRKAFPMAPADNFALINEFHEELVKAMHDAGLLHEATSGNQVNYAIDPEVMIAGRSVHIYQCDHCNSLLQTTAHNTLARETPCLDYRCPGKYTTAVANQLNYYQQVYNRNRSPRIYASEHTGMLPRGLREDVEYDFKQRPTYNSLNTLVATSTLEMGIDIGTLNSVINNSIPPATANYLQRVGRAGRSSGTALVTNFAEGRNHDLFHFAEPVGMMDGEVHTPGCFLEAKDILRRHFLAYCLDCWATLDPWNNRFPNRISSLKLATADPKDGNFIVNKLLAFIKTNEADLFGRFRNIYHQDQLPDEVFAPLAEKLRTDIWYQDIRDVFSNLKTEIRDLLKKQQEIEQSITDRKLAVTDPDYTELKAEIRSLNGIRKVLEKRSPVEHLTNRGLLPNYAFPETGVKLQGSVRGYTAKGSNAAPVHEEFEIVRDAATALKELAPANDFYGLGYKFHISGLNTYDWNDPGVLLTKRFCSNCDHLENDMHPVAPNCPKCGDLSWGAESNKHTFVRLTAVKSSNKREDATLDDSSEERKDAYYRRTRHLCFDGNTSCGGMGLKEIPFGIEYVKHVTCTEINLGESSVVHSNKIRLNQIEDIPRHGFITCRYCGKTSIWAHQAVANDGHYAYCKHRDKTYTGESNDTHFKEVFLYREMETEALKILLPVQEFDTAEVMELFKAGIEASLRLYYKGNPGHIALWDYREFNSQTQRFDRYLVLFDKIPGGTGYLEKLFNKDELAKLLTLAYQHIRDCGCQHQGKRGCYRCIFTYQNQYVQDELDRAKAEALFAKIVSRLKNWEMFPEGLGTVAGSGRIEESELEDRFIRLLKNAAKKYQAQGWDFVEQRAGTVFYQLTVAHNGLSYTWQIRPQIDLGEAQGIAAVTRADFLATLVSVKESGAEQEDVIYDEAPRWAIFLDGYAYHAHADNMRFFGDLEKRTAIAKSGKYLSWTLTWDDLDLFEHKLDKAGPMAMADRLWPDPARYHKTRQVYSQHYKKWFSPLADATNSMDRLLCLLAQPFQANEAVCQKALLLATLQQTPKKPSFDAADLERILPGHIPPDIMAAGMKDCYFVSEASFTSNFARLNIAVHMQKMHAAAALQTNEQETQIQKADWIRFWQAYNLVQENLLQIEAPQSKQAHGNSNGDDILRYYDEDLHGIVKQLVKVGIPVSPEGSFFLEESGFDHAEAALGHKTKKLFIKAIGPEDQDLFIKAGYKEVNTENFDINLWK